MHNIGSTRNELKKLYHYFILSTYSIHCIHSYFIEINIKGLNTLGELEIYSINRSDLILISKKAWNIAISEITTEYLNNALLNNNKRYSRFCKLKYF